MKKFFILMLSAFLLTACNSGDEGGTDDTTNIDDYGEGHLDSDEIPNLVGRTFRILDLFVHYENPSLGVKRIKVYEDLSECISEYRLKFDASNLLTNRIYENDFVPHQTNCPFQINGTRYLDDNKAAFGTLIIVNDGFGFRLTNDQIAVMKNKVPQYRSFNIRNNTVVIRTITFTIEYFPENLHLDADGYINEYDNPKEMHKVKKIEFRMFQEL